MINFKILFSTFSAIFLFAMMMSCNKDDSKTPVNNIVKEDQVNLRWATREELQKLEKHGFFANSGGRAQTCGWAGSSSTIECSGGECGALVSPGTVCVACQHGDGSVTKGECKSPIVGGINILL